MSVSQYTALEGERFKSFRQLAQAMSQADVRRAKNLDRTRPMREANKRRTDKKG